ncbi:cytochrome P450 [Jidongwangia harbinensis]|uniref:cytochrome P450 n=1 Tax=Jidongwangia harbinensis TaxID=2878561 RepID=UPI001CD9F37D|nr:cytochrome P450 [Jidongwangia harbinensis]MCA2211611.1 cytochrome P450 [Jidongwangia harbinensis]
MSEAVATATGQLSPFDPSDPALLSDPYPVYARYRAAEPVHWGLPALVGYPGAWYVFGHADALTVLRDPRFGKARRAGARAGAQPAADAIPEEARPYLLIGQQWIAHRDPPDHTRLHGVLWPHFTTGAVQARRDRMTTLADGLLDEILRPGGGEIDVVADYAARLPFHVICDIMGIPRADWPDFARWSAPMRAVGTRTPLPVWARASEAATAARDRLAELVAERRRRPTGDLIDDMRLAREGGHFVSDEELHANLLFVLYAAAGLHTMTALVSSAVRLLLAHPDQLAALRADDGLLAGAVTEALRFEPPLQMTNRVAVADVPLGGRTVRAGDSVLAMLAAANRDPAAHEQPDRFDITRRRRPHLSFSAGIHTCFGAPLALAEGEVAIGALLRRLDRPRPAGPAQWTPTGSLRLLRTLPLRYHDDHRRNRP